MIPASLSQAKADPRLRGPSSAATLAAYIFCLEYLDAQTHRPLKIAVLALAVRCKRDSAILALDRLVAAGYIEEGKRGTNGRTFRLLPAPLPFVKPRAA